MYHQCLICGAVYTRGSPEIFEGCSRCGKAKFSFTRNPLPEGELLELKKEAHDDLGILMKEIFNRNLNVSELSSDESKMIGEEAKGWVKVKMEDVPGIEEKAVHIEQTATSVRPRINMDDAPEGEGISEMDTMKDLYPREKVSSGKPEITLQESRRKPIWGKKVHMAPESVEVIRETEDGVYEIDLSRMLDNMLAKTPVVMMESGVYLIKLD
ncbi:MAG: Zn-ribbon containing protein [Candidatus Thermoplasmatota archaeon]|nr:Zn-ribbon containing protein [Candidatus Thermoplasmatota archaeon]